MTLLKIKKPHKSYAREKEKLLKKMAESTDGVKRLNANIPTRLHNELKLYALNEKRSIGDIIIEIIEKYLK